MNIMVFLTCDYVCFSYAPWCPACKSLLPTWDKLALRSFELDMNFAKIDVTENAGVLFSIS